MAQNDNPPEDLIREDFREWLKTEWYDGFQNISSNTSSGYTLARLEMYNVIDNFADTMFCMYSALPRVVPPDGFNSASEASPFDCEHIVPQSIFNSAGPMKNDIFHLTPTFSNWNSTRGNAPFRDINDDETEKWIYLDDNNECSNAAPCVPAGDIDIYTECESSASGIRWEPRESVKGNVARAVFYFFTMYPAYDINLVGDIETLYQWHLDDPVDAIEMARNDATENYQGNRNPYIDHADWVFKAWLEEPVVSVQPFYNAPISVSQLLNHRDTQQVQFLIENNAVRDLKIEVYRQDGGLLFFNVLKNKSDKFIYSFNRLSYPEGIYLIVIKNKSNNKYLHSSAFQILR